MSMDRVLMMTTLVAPRDSFMENAIIYDRRPFIKDGVVSWPWAGDSPMLWISSRDSE